MRICSFCGGDLDSTAGCSCPRGGVSIPIPPVLPPWPAPSASATALHDEIVELRQRVWDLEGRASVAEARAEKAEREIAKWQHTAAAISMCADGTSEDQTHERLPVLVAERIDEAERERDEARGRLERATAALELAILWAKGGRDVIADSGDADEEDIAEATRAIADCEAALEAARREP